MFNPKPCEMKALTACCGLDCEQCEVRVATIINDDALRREVARKWAEWNNAPYIRAEHINCMGCRAEGCKTYYCTEMCAIRRCVMSKNFGTCAECHDMSTCELLAEVAHNAPEVWNNLKEAGAEG